MCGFRPSLLMVGIVDTPGLPENKGQALSSVATRPFTIQLISLHMCVCVWKSKGVCTFHGAQLILPVTVGIACRSVQEPLARFRIAHVAWDRSRRAAQQQDPRGAAHAWLEEEARPQRVGKLGGARAAACAARRLIPLASRLQTRVGGAAVFLAPCEMCRCHTRICHVFCPSPQQNQEQVRHKSDPMEFGEMCVAEEE